ncbi:unnamed protein product [Aspergillus oryzae]|uniref:Unnamed protein product n=2 Tax=Aspergillus oryzae TaxID=5062 RepID=A0AAN5BQ14_ASPOZ|nr:unnamed protein product [Aspergillus oryzae]GMF95777.1 unnamed protein product [Aspergillus oryzae]GMG07014.1 unnamed protein product [Aspergillus oryzae]GMG26867.1 unnamed protein product [Aspergillus oryzae]GMG54806.1 unnamed protein product [Aspergillus oryzae var. brunneus]
MNPRKEGGSRKTAISAHGHQFCFTRGITQRPSYLPCKSVDHTATGGHDTRGCEKNANQREPRVYQLVMYLALIARKGTTYIRRQIDPALFPVASLKICRRHPAAESMTL